MDDLAFIKSRIAAFAGYADEAARYLSDRQVRAFVGETLGMLHERLEGKLDEGLSAPLERILLRCEFSDPKFITALQRRSLSGDDVQRLHAADRELIESAITLAQTSLGMTPGDLVERMGELEALFDRRYATVCA